MRRLLGRNAEVACAFIAYLVRRKAQIQEDLANNLLSSSEQRFNAGAFVFGLIRPNRRIRS